VLIGAKKQSNFCRAKEHREIDSRKDIGLGNKTGFNGAETRSRASWV
jgi:hypothetical protein